VKSVGISDNLERYWAVVGKSGHNKVPLWL
jgi:hypothetical protein